MCLENLEEHVIMTVNSRESEKKLFHSEQLVKRLSDITIMLIDSLSLS